MSVALDVAEVGSRLGVWLAECVEEPVDVIALERPVGGLSRYTLLCDATWSGETHRLVVRIEPGDDAIFPHPSVVMERSVLASLGEHTEVPVPAARWLEPRGDVLGRPFFVMDRVPGHVPSDTFLVSGFAFEADREAQAALQRSTVDVLGAIHQIDWRAAGLDRLARPQYGNTSLDRELGYWSHYLDWAEADGPLPRLRWIHSWCLENRPRWEPEPALCWGDARYGNIVYGRDMSVSAVLDWEMALLGPPELDVGWFLFIHDTALMWMPDLAGFAERSEVLTRYERVLGRSLADLTWYEVWAGLRAGAIQARIVARSHRDDPAVGLDGRERNPVMASIRRLVDLPG